MNPMSIYLKALPHWKVTLSYMRDARIMQLRFKQTPGGTTRAYFLPKSGLFLFTMAVTAMRA
jgi:hypothetical protein